MPGDPGSEAQRCIEMLEIKEKRSSIKMSVSAIYLQLPWRATTITNGSPAIYIDRVCVCVSAGLSVFSYVLVRFSVYILYAFQ